MLVSDPTPRSRAHEKVRAHRGVGSETTVVGGSRGALGNRMSMGFGWSSGAAAQAERVARTGDIARWRSIAGAEQRGLTRRNSVEGVTRASQGRTTPLRGGLRDAGMDDQRAWGRRGHDESSVASRLDNRIE